MAAGTRFPIVLPPSEQARLEGIAVSRRHARREIRNAQILLLRHDHVTVRQIVALLHCSTATIAAVCRA